MRSYRPEELFDARGAPAPDVLAAAPARRAPHERQPARQRRPAQAARSCCPSSASTRSRWRRPRRGARTTRAPSACSCATCCGATLRTSACSAPTRPPRTARRGLRGQQEALARRQPARGRRRRRARAGRPRGGDAERAHARGHARGLPAQRAPRAALVLRGLRPRHRLDVQPARQVARHLQPHLVARGDRLAEPADHLHGLAPGPQRLHAPGSRLPRSGREQEPEGDPHLPSPRRQLPARRRGPLPAQRELRERRGLRQAVAPPVPGRGGRGHPLRQGPRHLGLGQQRPGRGARPGDGLARATSRPSRRSPRPRCCAPSSPTARSAS